MFVKNVHETRFYVTYNHSFLMQKPEFITLPSYHEYSIEEMQSRAQNFSTEMQRRRTVRHFSDRAVSREVIEQCVQAAGTAPSGANMQPWHFVVVAEAATKHAIRISAEEEEREFYEKRAPQEWLDALSPLGTDADKPFLETAPYLIAIFAEKHGTLPDGRTVKHYYVQESVGIATGILITALHTAGLASLTHTPSPMNFLNEILERPPHERPFLLLVVGYPSEDAVVPNIHRKALEEIVTWK
jgi:iodotyrosine deiodinase